MRFWHSTLSLRTWTLWRTVGATRFENPSCKDTVRTRSQDGTGMWDKPPCIQKALLLVVSGSQNLAACALSSQIAYYLNHRQYKGLQGRIKDGHRVLERNSIASFLIQALTQEEPCPLGFPDILTV